MSSLRDQLLAGGRGRDEGDLPPLVTTFLRGLSLGALVGAALAGSLLLRRRAGDREASERPEPKRVGPPA